VVLHTLGAIFSNQSTLDDIFACIFREFATIFKDIVKVFTDFAQILPGFVGILPGFSPNPLHPRLLHH